MKLIINYEGVKREIQGSFSICGSKQDLETLISFVSEGISDSFGYGWVDIHPSVIPIRANEHPLNWYEDAT